MCEKGTGVQRSKSVAADWYYKAGQAYLKQGKKEKALSCCDAIKAAVSDSPIAAKLLAEIQSAEKDAPSTRTEAGPPNEWKR